MAEVPYRDYNRIRGSSTATITVCIGDAEGRIETLAVHTRPSVAHNNQLPTIGVWDISCEWSRSSDEDRSGAVVVGGSSISRSRASICICAAQDFCHTGCCHIPESLKSMETRIMKLVQSLRTASRILRVPHRYSQLCPHVLLCPHGTSTFSWRRSTSNHFNPPSSSRPSQCPAPQGILELLVQ